MKIFEKIEKEVHLVRWRFKKDSQNNRLCPLDLSLRLKEAILRNRQRKKLFYKKRKDFPKIFK